MDAGCCQDSERLREVTGRLYSLGIVDPFLRQEVSLAHHVECHFFSISANKVIEYRHWVTNLGLCRDVDFSEIDQFSKDDIKDLRDMREHIIEYFQGEGHKRKRWFIEPPERPGGIIDASSVIDTIIGGRLDWVEFSGAAERLLPLLLLSQSHIPRASTDKSNPLKVPYLSPNSKSPEVPPTYQNHFS